VLTFGATGGDVRAEAIELDDMARPRFTLATPWGSAVVQLAVTGAHMAVNAAAAATVGLVLDVPLAEVVAGLEGATLSPWRMEVARTPSGALVVNDAYNANPTSMAAALEALAALPATGRKVAVLGPMAELGDDAPERHVAMAAVARSLGLPVVAVGTPDYGDGDGITRCDDIDAALAALGPLGPDDAVLVKGSRVAGLERLAERLLRPQ
jgi:UDP-N-acetylmuramoyl-tripeptide--D-alanyl-D-alanine ligase